MKTDDPTPAEAFRTAEEEEADSLSQRLLASGDFTTASALAFLVFILLYMPCIATVAAIGAEAGWKWAAASVVYNTTLAWFVAWSYTGRTDILTMNWQDYIVAAIGLAVAAIVARRLWCFARGRRRGGCASCASGAMPAQEAHRQELICRTRLRRGDSPNKFGIAPWHALYLVAANGRQGFRDQG